MANTPYFLTSTQNPTGFSATYSSYLPRISPGATIAYSVPVDCNNLIIYNATIGGTGAAMNGVNNGKSKVAVSFPSSSSPADEVSATWISAYISPVGSSFEMLMVMTKLTLSSDPSIAPQLVPQLQAYDSEARYLYPCPSPCTLDTITVNNAWVAGTVSTVASTSSNGYLGVSYLQIISSTTTFPPSPSPSHPPSPRPPPPSPSYNACQGLGLSCGAVIPCGGFVCSPGQPCSCITVSCCGSGWTNSSVTGVRCMEPKNSMPFQNSYCGVPYPPPSPPAPPSPPPPPPTPSPPPPPPPNTPTRCYGVDCLMR